MVVGSNPATAQGQSGNPQLLAQLEHASAAMANDAGSLRDRIKRSGERLDETSDGDSHAEVVIHWQIVDHAPVPTGQAIYHSPFLAPRSLVQQPNAPRAPPAI
jgi:hypothetical protein